MTKASFQSSGETRRIREKRRSRSIVLVGPVSPDKGQLLSQKQDFRAEGCARAEQETKKEALP